MKFVDGDGRVITDLGILDPWEHSVLFENGTASPITKVTYGYNMFSVEWTTDPEFEWEV